MWLTIHFSSRLRLVSAGSDCTIQTVVLSVGDDEDEDDRVPVSEWEGTPVWIKMSESWSLVSIGWMC